MFYISEENSSHSSCGRDINFKNNFKKKSYLFIYYFGMSLTMSF